MKSCQLGFSWKTVKEQYPEHYPKQSAEQRHLSTSNWSQFIQLWWSFKSPSFHKCMLGRRWSRLGGMHTHMHVHMMHREHYLFRLMNLRKCCFLCPSPCPRGKSIKKQPRCCEIGAESQTKRIFRGLLPNVFVNYYRYPHTGNSFGALGITAFPLLSLW